jgi:hypothetical protein
LKYDEKLVGEKRQTKKEDVMDSGQVSVKEILERQLGDEKTARVLKGINDAYREGKRGEELQGHFKDAVKKEGLDPGDIQIVSSHILPNF